MRRPPANMAQNLGRGSSGPLAPNSAEAYGEARRRERDVILPDGTTHAGPTPAHRRRVALLIARMTGKRVGRDTTTQMLE